MKEYIIKVTHAPLLREGSRPPASLCEVLPAGGILHLRWAAAEGGSVSCAVGLPDAVTLDQAKLRLQLDGFLVSSPEAVPAKETACQILHRSVQQRYISGGAGPAQRMALPERMLTAGAFDAFLARLRRIKGCAVHLLVRRCSGLNDTVQRQLQTRTWPAESLPGQLLIEGALYEAVICISGDPSGLLAAEVCTAFGGALTTENAAAPIDGRIFETAPCPSGVVPLYKPLCYSYLPYEAAALTSLTASAGQYGLPVNNDTLPGPPSPFETDGDLFIGKDCQGGLVKMPLRNLPLGTAILGTPGSGKGNLLVTLAMQLAKKKIPTLIIESAKEELHHLRKVGVDINTYRPVEGEFLLDPFALPPNVTLGQYRDALLQTLRAAFRLDGPLEELFSAALDRTFAVHGFGENSKAGDPGTTPFGLNELMQAFNTELRERGYSPKTESDMRTAGLVRLNALFNQNRPIYDTTKSIPSSEFAKGFNLIQLASLTSIEGKQAFASLLLISLSLWARLNLTHTAGKRVNLVIILDEAHNLLTGCRRTTGDEYSFAADFTNMILELRSLGVAIVIADQSAKNIPDVLYDVCAQKFFLGPNPGSGITDHAGEMKLDEAALSHQYLLGPGEGFYKAPEMPQSVFFSSLNLIDTLKIEEPCERRNAFLEQHPRFCIESYAECEVCPARGKCTLAGKAAARAIAARLSASWKARFVWALKLPGHTPEEAAARSKALSDSLRRRLLDARAQSQDDRCIYFCAVIGFFRSFNREAAVPVSIRKTIDAAKTLMPE